MIGLIWEQEYIFNHQVGKIEYTESILGYVQRTMQAIREVVKNDDEYKRESTLSAISELYPQSVTVANRLVESNFIQQAIDDKVTYDIVFDKIVEELEKLI